MTPTHIATISPAQSRARTSNDSAAVSQPAPALRVHFGPHNATSGDETPTTITAKAITAAEQRKRTKLGPDIVALIELQKPTAIQELIFELSTMMITLNTKVYERTESAGRFDLKPIPINIKSWLPGNVKKIKIRLQSPTELADDEEYRKLAAECETTVEKFQDDLKYIYYRAAVRERKYAKEKRLREFVKKSHSSSEHIRNTSQA